MPGLVTAKQRCKSGTRPASRPVYRPNSTRWPRRQPPVTPRHTARATYRSHQSPTHASPRGLNIVRLPQTVASCQQLPRTPWTISGAGLKQPPAWQQTHLPPMHSGLRPSLWISFHHGRKLRDPQTSWTSRTSLAHASAHRHENASTADAVTALARAEAPTPQRWAGPCSLRSTEHPQ